MQKIALLYNPASGTSRERRIAQVESAAGVLRSEGHDVLTFPTQSSDSVSQQIERLLRDEFTTEGARQDRLAQDATPYARSLDRGHHRGG